MTLSIVSEICSRRRIIGPISLRAISVRIGARLAVSDPATGGQTAENGWAISMVAATMPPASALVAITTTTSPTTAMMAGAVMAILDRLRVRSDFAHRAVRDKRRSRGRLDRDERRLSCRQTHGASHDQSLGDCHRSRHGIHGCIGAVNTQSPATSPPSVSAALTLPNASTYSGWRSRHRPCRPPAQFPRSE